MNATLKGCVAASLLFGFASVAQADTRINVVWHCEFLTGKTPEEVHAVNGRWVKWINGKVKGGVHSYMARPVVGKLGHFKFVDSYASMADYAAARVAGQSDEGKALDKEFDAVIKCEKNELYEIEESMSAK